MLLHDISSAALCLVSFLDLHQEQLLLWTDVVSLAKGHSAITKLRLIQM